MSNLQVTSKITEKSVAIQLQDHMTANNLFPVLQSAYRQNHSTETALLKVKNDLLLNMDKGHVTLLVMLDLSAAFDTVDHGILLHRLQSKLGFGIRLYYGLNPIWREERSRSQLTDRSLINLI